MEIKAIFFFVIGFAFIFYLKTFKKLMVSAISFLMFKR